MRRHGIELVFTPTNASWLNWIEAEFTALRYFTLDGSDYPSHTAQERPRSPVTSAGPTAARLRSDASPSTPRSAGPITYPTLRDAALVLQLQL